jgi:hypothetical protein
VSSFRIPGKRRDKSRHPNREARVTVSGTGDGARAGILSSWNPASQSPFPSCSATQVFAMPGLMACTPVNLHAARVSGLGRSLSIVALLRRFGLMRRPGPGRPGGAEAPHCKGGYVANALRCTTRSSAASAAPVRAEPVRRRSCPCPMAGNSSALAAITSLRNLSTSTSEGRG